MKRNEIKAAVRAAVKTDKAFAAQYDAYWRAKYDHPGDMLMGDWKHLYALAPETDATPTQPAIEPTPAPTKETPVMNTRNTPAKPVDLDAALEGLSVVLSDTAIAPIKAGVDALKKEAAQALVTARNAAQAAQATAPVKPGTHVAQLVKTVKLNTLVGGRGELVKSVDVEIYDHPDAPVASPNWVAPKCLPEVMTAMNLGHNVCFFGDRGTGKSTTVREIAAMTGRPHFEIAFHEEISQFELFGQRGIAKDGSTDQWDAGVLLTAITTPHAVIDLSEMSVSRPGLVMGLNPVLERGSRSIMLDGVLHRVHPTVTFFATSNDPGNGENAARFQGVRPMNDATRSRFVWVELNLPEKAQLTKMISKAANLPRTAAEHLAAYDMDIRAQVSKGECEATPGMRAYVAWGEMVKAGVPSKSAFDMAVRHTGTSVDASVWAQRMETMFDHVAFTNEAQGVTPTPTAATPTPTQDGTAGKNCTALDVWTPDAPSVPGTTPGTHHRNTLDTLREIPDKALTNRNRPTPTKGKHHDRHSRTMESRRSRQLSPSSC